MPPGRFNSNADTFHCSRSSSKQTRQGVEKERTMFVQIRDTPQPKINDDAAPTYTGLPVLVATTHVLVALGYVAT